MVAILLSTFNGGPYLKELLDSLIGQSFKDWKLFIRDDGSTDKTLKIIEKYQKLHKNIELIAGGLTNKRLGPSKSFFYLLEQTDADFYFFCDQDDIWLPDKIAKSLNLLKQIEKKNPLKPALVFTDLRIVDTNLNILNKSLWKYFNFDQILSPKYLCCINFITGCTICFNRPAKEIALKFKNFPLMHDEIMGAAVSRYGKIQPLPEPLILYRQHASNVVGANRERKFIFYRMFRQKDSLQAIFWNIYQNLKGKYDIYKFKKRILRFTFLKFFLLQLMAICKRYKK